MNDVIQKIYDIGIVPVIAIDDADKAVPLAKALVKGGLPAAEVTFRTAAAEEAIKRIVAEVPEMLVGAGTVLTKEQADRAIAAGVKFIVSPGFNPEITKYVIDKGMLMMPGTATPGEMEQAMSMGLDVVKFFPAEQNGGVQSVARIFALIEVLCAHPKGASLQTISAESGLPKSTAHRLLSSLVSLGYAVQDSFSTHYRLTMKMFELSSGIVNDMDIMSVAKPHLDKLSRHTGEAVHLVIQDGVDIVYIYKAEAGAGLGGMRMSSHVGLRIPMYCTGVGKAILATQSYGEAERVWRKSSIRALTAHTITDFDAFIEQLKRVRMAGYAIDDEENELGIRCVALAVPGMNGRAEAAFSISGLAAQMTDDRIEHLARMGLAARQDILRDLGWK